MSIPQRRTARVLVATIAILVAQSCGGGSTGGDDPDPNGPPQPPPGPPTAALTVDMITVSGDGYGGAGEQNYFSPNNANLSVGGTVTWSNGTSTQHNVTFSSGTAPANIGNMSSDSESRTFPTVGAFAYQCTNHSGMTGTINVQ